MRGTRDVQAVFRGVSGVVIVTVVAMAAPGIGSPERTAPASPAAPDSVVQPVVRDTRTNLQSAFGDEVNAKVRYESAAEIADREGYPYVGRLFRACARAEQVHADRHVHAIAWAGDDAKALLDRLALGTTAENLRAAIDLETYDATRLYPALLAQARADRMTEAVRSMNFALAAEREHVLLLTAALETLEQRPAPATFYVCPGGGRTTGELGFEKCPNCFTSARKFVRVD